MTIAKNIKALRTARDWTQEQLADKVGVSRSTVTQWETGWSKPRMGAIERVASAFGVAVSDIVSDAPKRSIPDGAIAPKPSRVAFAPLLGRVHAGDVQEPEVLEDEMSLPYEVLERHPKGYFLEVEGDCMDMVYPEGCYILVDPDVEPRTGSIAAVMLDGHDAVMRRMVRTTNTLILSPESHNREHRDIVITEDSEHTVELVGTVVWFQASKEME